MPVKVVDLAEEEAKLGPAGKHSLFKIIFDGEDGPHGFHMTYTEFPLGARSKEHTHGGEQVIFVLSGELTIELPELPDKPSLRVPAGSAVYVPPQIKHTHVNSGTETLRTLVILCPGGDSSLLKKAPRVDPSKW